MLLALNSSIEIAWCCWQCCGGIELAPELFGDRMFVSRAAEMGRSEVLRRACRLAPTMTRDHKFLREVLPYLDDGESLKFLDRRTRALHKDTQGSLNSAAAFKWRTEVRMLRSHQSGNSRKARVARKAERNTAVSQRLRGGRHKGGEAHWDMDDA
jgi:hypothetical protein